ncbi:uncharacterized protein BKA78DRAFT_300752 [Phyllosticta capitalensis]|uniref:Uncharacterized protein n=1 Tax=Phyllosticta capitalensis TaxID=121624 RepID=A0ABR1Y8Q4_9PEZI
MLSHHLSCGSEISFSTTSSTSSFEPPDTFWFYEQTEFPAMKTCIDQDGDVKPRHLRAWRAIKSSLKRNTSSSARNNKTNATLFGKLCCFLSPRFSKNGRESSDPVSEDPSARPSRLPRRGMDLDRTGDSALNVV